tara:strand:- start:32450 stop:32932 length:483 start_codon:yes stop_codon:yes gene_type:complete
MIIAIALASTALAMTDTCIDHTSYTFELAAARLANVEILRSEPTGRAERGSFPDGTLVTLSAGYCTTPVIVMSVDAPIDGQTAMRLGQLMGRLDRITGCVAEDYDALDTAFAATAEAMTTGGSYLDGDTALAEAAANTIRFSAHAGDGRMLAEFTCTKHE